MKTSRVANFCALLFLVFPTACEKKSEESYTVAKPGMPINIVETSNRLSFQLNAEKVCFWGDMDTLVKENYKGGNLIFTLESVHPRYNNKFKPLTKSVSMNAIEKGVTVDFDLPKVKEPVHLGLFVCKDNKKHGQCNRKRPYNLAKLSEIMFQQSMYRASKTTKADKPYYFQYVLLTPTHVQTFSEAVDNKYLEKIWAKKIIKSLGGNKKYHSDSLSKAFHMQRILTSRRLNVRSKGKHTFLSASMPRMDMDGCGFVKNRSATGTDKPFQVEVWKGPKGAKRYRKPMKAHINRTPLKAPDKAPKNRRIKRKPGAVAH